MIHYQAIKNTKTFCINQKVTFWEDLGAYFLSKRDSSFNLVMSAGWEQVIEPFI